MFMRSRGVQPDIEEVTQVPDWGSPVKLYVQECIKSVGKDAVIKLGQHGGFIDPYDSELSGREFNIDLREPTQSDAVPLTPQSDIPVAYWFYMTGDMIHLNSVPQQITVENQLNMYIERNIDSCIDGFESFKEQGFDIEKTGEVKVETTLTQSDVLFRLIYPIRISKDEQSIDVSTYRESLDVGLQNIFNLAIDIAVTQSNRLFLEALVREMITAYSGIDINKLPPIAASDNKMYAISWPMAWARKMFTDKLMSFIQYINIEGTKGAVHLTNPNPIIQGIYDKFYIDVSGDNITFPGLNVDFLYLGWPIDFNILPNSGGKISPDIDSGGFGIGAISFGPTVRTNEYRFYYDVIFPVIVKIRDDDAFHGEGYSLFFALEGNIRRNRDVIELLQIGGLVNPVQTYTDPQGEIAPIPKNFFCNEGQKLVPVKIGTYDASNFKAIEDVEVYYGCGTFKRCPIGITKYDTNSESAFFEGKFPICAGGYLLLKKPGYLDKAILFSTIGPGIDSTSVKEANVAVEPIREKGVSLKIYRMELPDQCCPGGDQLQEGETAMFIIDKVVDPKDPYDHPLTNMILFTEGEDFSAIKLNLVPGEYEVNGMFFSENKHTMYPNTDHICTSTLIDFQTDDSWDFATNTPRSRCYSTECEIGGSCTGTAPGGIPVSCCDSASVWYPEEEFEINIIGGVEITEANGGIWRVYKADLDSNNEVELHAIVPPKARCLSTDDCVVSPVITMDEMNKVDAYSVSFRDFALPRFK